MEAQPAQQPPQEDISSKTILLLVILTLAVSFIGAWVNINTALTATAPTPSHAAQAGNSAEVNFYLQPPAPKQETTATAMVSLDLVK